MLRGFPVISCTDMMHVSTILWSREALGFQPRWYLKQNESGWNAVQGSCPILVSKKLHFLWVPGTLPRYMDQYQVFKDQNPLLKVVEVLCFQAMDVQLFYNIRPWASAAKLSFHRFLLQEPLLLLLSFALMNVSICRLARWPLTKTWLKAHGPSSVKKQGWFIIVGVLKGRYLNFYWYMVRFPIWVMK